MSGPWFAVPADFFGSEQERALFERWGWCGVALWLAFMAACKRARVEGQVPFYSEHEHLAELGMLGRPLADVDGKPFTLEEFYRWTGRHHWTRRLRRAVRLQGYDRLQRYRVYPRAARHADKRQTTDTQTTPSKRLTSTNAAAEAAQASDKRQTTDTQTRKPQVRGQKRGRQDVSDRTHVGTTPGGTSTHQGGRRAARGGARRPSITPDAARLQLADRCATEPEAVAVMRLSDEEVMAQWETRGDAPSA